MRPVMYAPAVVAYLVVAFAPLDAQVLAVALLVAFYVTMGAKVRA